MMLIKHAFRWACDKHAPTDRWQSCKNTVSSKAWNFWPRMVLAQYTSTLEMSRWHVRVESRELRVESCVLPIPVLGEISGVCLGIAESIEISTIPSA